MTNYIEYLYGCRPSYRCITNLYRCVIYVIRILGLIVDEHLSIALYVSDLNILTVSSLLETVDDLFRINYEDVFTGFLRMMYVVVTRWVLSQIPAVLQF